jgi:hypothetical protein
MFDIAAKVQKVKGIKKAAEAAFKYLIWLLNQ